MAQCVEEDIYQLETGLRNLNVELKKDYKVGMENSLSQKGCSASNVQPLFMPNACEQTQFAQNKPINSTRSNSENSLSWNAIESDKPKSRIKMTPVTKVNEENLATLPDLSCAQQARNEDCSSVNELAGYFDNLLYIPKKMSPMAEMMYM